MAKKAAPKNTESMRLDWCRDCQYNLGEGSLGHMWQCSLLGYCVVFNLGYCKAEKIGKGKFQEKK